MAQCLHEGETRAVFLRKKGPVRRRALPGRALYPEFLSEETELRSVKSGKAFHRGSASSGKNMHCSSGLCPRDREQSVSGGKALYPGSVISEFHCSM